MSSEPLHVPLAVKDKRTVSTTLGSFHAFYATGPSYNPGVTGSASPVLLKTIADVGARVPISDLTRKFWRDSTTVLLGLVSGPDRSARSHTAVDIFMYG